MNLKKIQNELQLPDTLYTILDIRLLINKEPIDTIVNDIVSSELYKDVSSEKVRKYLKYRKKVKIFTTALEYVTIASIVGLTGSACYFLGQKTKLGDKIAEISKKNAIRNFLNNIYIDAKNNNDEVRFRRTNADGTQEYLVIHRQDTKPDTWIDGKESPIV